MADTSVSPFAVKEVTGYVQTYPLYQYANNEYDPKALEEAQRAFKALQAVQSDGTIRTAALLGTKVLCESTLDFRFLHIWLAMACLFGPADGKEIVYRLSQRVAFFLEADGGKAKDIFEQVKECYGVRSKLVHGFRVASVKDDDFVKHLVDSETILRRSLLEVLGTPSIIANMDGKTREAYLNGLERVTK